MTGPSQPYPPQQPNQGQPSHGQPQYGPPPLQYGYRAPQPPRKKTPVWPWILIGAVILLCSGCFGIVGLSAKDSPKTNAHTSEVAAPGQQQAPAAATPTKAHRTSSVAAPGSEVRDGKFAFVVTRVDPPVKVVGDNQFLRKEAQGEYILVHVTVSNVGDKPRSYFGSNQQLIDDQGREFTNDTGAEINLNDHQSADINPGNKISVVIAFDVPQGAVPAAIEFHDSAFSGGVRVALL